MATLELLATTAWAKLIAARASAHGIFGRSVSDRIGGQRIAHLATVVHHKIQAVHIANNRILAPFAQPSPAPNLRKKLALFHRACFNSNWDRRP
jgi:hypothetical protein